ncbi:MAG TPA: hypothetical protein VD999_02465 [Vitreimonas sp.]|nr:hypothetical protein [Vitreimonas sp.]
MITENRVKTSEAAQHAKERKGVYCYFVLPTGDGDKLVLFQLPEEDFSNGGKQEGEPEVHEYLIPFAPSMISLVSGGAKEESDFHKDMLREIESEAGLALQPGDITRLSEQPVTSTIQDRRDRGTFNILGIPFLYSVTPYGLAIAKLHAIRHKQQMVVATPAELVNNEKYQLRPFAQTAVRVLPELMTSKTHSIAVAST